MDLTIGIVLQNLATMSNFVEFRDYRILHIFRGNERNAGHLAHFEWLTVVHVSGAELLEQGESSGAHVNIWHLLIRGKSQSRWIRDVGVIQRTNSNWTCGMRGQLS